MQKNSDKHCTNDVMLYNDEYNETIIDLTILQGGLKTITGLQTVVLNYECTKLVFYHTRI